ncbi:retropepsin-like aspartic protease [Thiohalomonas denitrificans]|uniref:Aspartyl protease n=1 Tax=Thiohalomonas denitrificans TaxID=415747 RepID=A0A1G5QH44_9GAMM|nr:retropepsin-like aspartic protease [Thiohalomonas denitrificans]SCZ61205.1 Aspartyl protease [Thiohalomonas denitrificans]
MSALFNEEHPIKRLQEAETLFTSGRFTEAAYRFRPLRYNRLVGNSARRRLAYVALISGNHYRAERQLRHLPREPESLKMSAALYRRSGQLATAASCVRALGSELMSHALRRLSEVPLTIDAPEIVRCPFSKLEPLPLLPVTIDGRETLFLLDTGSQEVVLDEKVVNQLELWQSAPQNALYAGGRSAALRYSRVGQLKLGEASFHNLPVQVQPLHATFKRMFDDVRVEGILGTSLLSHFFTEADFAAGELRLSRPENAPRENSHRFWLADAFLPLVRAGINGRMTLPMLLDTGQQGFAAALSVDAARAAKLPIADFPFTGEGGGGSVTVLPTRVESLQVADSEIVSPPAVCMPRFGLEHRFGFRVGGMIGYEAVRGRCLSLDFRRMRLNVGEH